jgi:GTP cyclohydrolase II
VSAGTIAHDISVDGRPKPVRAYSSFGGDPEFSSNVAVVYGEVEHGSLVRIHSRCTYSEVFASHECDCGWQLQRSRHLLTVRGGVLIYLDQEGRGAGLRAKADAYRMHQKDGLDTFQAYEKLGLPADSRDYADAAKLLKEELRLHWVKLLTNNPDKIAALENTGIKVERVPLVAKPTPATIAYLEAKKLHGHLLLRAAANKGTARSTRSRRAHYRRVPE